MQTVLTYLALLLTTWFLGAQNSVEVTITGFDSNEGNAKIGLYDSKSGFLKNTFKSVTMPIYDKKVVVIFDDIPEGTYAVSVFHDEDADNEFDMYFGFFPAEDYGNSNNILNPFGPPKWEDAAFELKDGKGVTLEILMR